MNGRPRWTVEQMRTIIAEYEAAPHGTRAMVLKDHGVTGRQLRNWRASQDAGMLEMGVTVRTVRETPRPESAEIARLRQENARLTKDLERARKDVDDRQVALEALGKATALLHDVVSSKSAPPTSPPEPSARSR